MVLGTTSALGGADLEAVVEAAVDLLEVTHSAGAGGLSALGLLAPVELASLSGRVTAVGASRLLDVEGAAATTPAKSVSLVVALSEAGGTLRCKQNRYVSLDIVLVDRSDWAVVYRVGTYSS